MENKELVVREQEESIAGMLPSVLVGVDFSGLNKTIEALATHNGSISEKQKELAVGIIGEWEDNVISKLKSHNNELSEVINFFNLNTYGYYNSSGLINEDLLEAVSIKTNTTGIFNSIKMLTEQLEKFSATQPVKPDTRTMNLVDRIQADRDYELEYTKFDIERTKIQMQIGQAWRDWKNIVVEDDYIKDMLSKAKKYQRNLNKMISQCKDKSQLAKINVTIESEAVRESLKEMIDFTKSL